MADPTSFARTHAAPGGDAAFAATRWSMVLGARPGAENRAKALEELCATYWAPVYAYLRRSGHAPQDAEDLTQGFFATLLEGDFLERPDPARGRFRGYLVGALKRFLGDHLERERALKRGGGVEFIEWSTEFAELGLAAAGAAPSDPGQAFEAAFAATLLDQALRRLEEEQAAAGKAVRFAALKSFLSAAPVRGDYEAAARDLGATRANVALWVHRLNERYAELVKLEVAATLVDPADLRDELRHLLLALQ
jgi:RNA polymerase sigma factor (sigma-70 family)